MRFLFTILLFVSFGVSGQRINYNILPTNDSISGTDYFPALRAPNSQYKATYNDLIALMRDSISGSSIDTTAQFVKTITRTPGVDSFYFKVGSVFYSVKDSVGTTTPTGVYNKQDTGTVTTNGTSPTGTTNHRYSFEYCENGRAVHLHYIANWPNTGTGISTFTIPLPADCPTPQLPNGISGANVNIVPCFALLQTATTAETTARGILKVNAANTGYEIEVSAGSGNYRIANVSLTYFLDPP